MDGKELFMDGKELWIGLTWGIDVQKSMSADRLLGTYMYTSAAATRKLQ
jgi:hypothetical protein